MYQVSVKFCYYVRLKISLRAFRINEIFELEYRGWISVFKTWGFTWWRRLPIRKYTYVKKKFSKVDSEENPCLGYLIGWKRIII